MSKWNLGCGGEIKPGWINIDQYPNEMEYSSYIQCDLTKGLPAGLEAPELIYSCHFFEHLDDQNARALMRRCLEVLVDGGKFRMAVPDFERTFIAYVNREWEFFDILDWNAFSDPATRSFIDIVSYSVYQFGEHKSLWDREKAIRVLTHVGFKDVREVAYDDSFEPPYEFRRRYTFVVEGRK